MNIPVIINNRNLLTWTWNMVEKLKTLDNIGEIIIVDNASTYQPLLDWYATNPVDRIYRLDENIGKEAPWKSGIVDVVAHKKVYVVTDPDLDISNIPNDTLNTLLLRLNDNDGLHKVGLKLDWHSVKQDSPYYEHLNTYERTRWEQSVFSHGVYNNIHIDTTFALYNVHEFFIGGGSLAQPYMAKHIPWHYTEDMRNNDPEFLYYLKHASSDCTYKTHLGLDLNLTQIANKHRVDKGTEHFEAHGYTDVYGEFINKTDKYNLLEIGVWHGDSLRMFNEYNPNIKYTGIDIDPGVFNFLNDTEVGDVYIGSQSDDEFMNTILETIGDLDIMIDDGSHNYEDILKTFTLVAPRLKSGSIYFIEDLHAAHAKRDDLMADLLQAVSNLKIQIKYCRFYCDHKLLMIQL